MRSRRTLPIRPVFPRRYLEAANKKAPADPGPADLSSYLSYALLILYVLASVSATKDEMLLIAGNGIELPLVSVTVSITGFYFLCPIMVGIGHLVTLRRLPITFANRFDALKIQQNHSDIFGDKLVLLCLLIAGPLTLLFITYRFAAYQSPIHFLLHATILLYCWEASFKYYSKIVFKEEGKPLLLQRVVNETLNWILWVWLFICADVILIPANYSTTLALQNKTTWLTTADGTTVAWIPHISIDRASQLWSGAGNIESDLIVSSGHTDSKQWFMSRGVSLDLRGRNLRFLDLSQQVIPRIWAHDADLSGANFSHSKIYGSLFVNTSLTGANFELTGLDGASFMNTVIKNIFFNHTSLRGTYWDNVTVRNSYFRFTDFSLSSMYGVTFEKSEIFGGEFTAATFTKTDMSALNIVYKTPYKVLKADVSGDILNPDDPVFIVAPDDALKLLTPQICKDKIHSSWGYAWANFMLIRSLMSTVEEQSLLAVKKLYGQDQCKGLPTHPAWPQPGEE